MFKQFDMIRIKTTKNVTWMSKPEGMGNVDPNGKWSVVGSLGIYLLVCRNSVLVKIPFDDVEKIANYDITKLFEENNDGQGNQGSQGKEGSN